MKITLPQKTLKRSRPELCCLKFAHNSVSSPRGMDYAKQLKGKLTKQNVSSLAERRQK